MMENQVGTAGSPILNVLERNGLMNVIVIVTRYFGGILLGAGGLVRAYTEATVKATQNAKIVEKIQGVEIEITINYQDLEKFKYFCRTNNIEIKKIEYNENIKCNIDIENKENIEENLRNKGLQVDFLDIKILKNTYITRKIK